MSFGNRLSSYARLNLPDITSFNFFRSPNDLSELTAPQSIDRKNREQALDHRNNPDRPKKVIGRADLFTRYSDEKFLEGGNCRTALCVAGFSATHYPMSEIGHILNKRLDASVLLSPLAMHRTYEEFRNTKFDAWVERIDEQSARLGNPIGIFYSAASLAAIQVERMNPGRFKGMVFIGSPLRLASPHHQFAMSVCSTLREYTKDRFPGVADYINQKTFKIPTTYKGASKIVRKNAIYEDSSGAAFLELYKGQQLAFEGLKEIKCKILYFQGTNDQFVSCRVPNLLKMVYPNDLLTIHLIEGSHGPQLESGRTKMFAITDQWIRNELPH